MVAKFGLEVRDSDYCTSRKMSIGMSISWASFPAFLVPLRVVATFGASSASETLYLASNNGLEYALADGFCTLQVEHKKSDLATVRGYK